MLLLLLGMLGGVAADLRMAGYMSPAPHCMWPGASGNAQFKDLGFGKCITSARQEPTKKEFWKLASQYQCQTMCNLNSSCGGFSATVISFSRERGYGCYLWMDKPENLLSSNGERKHRMGGAHCHVRQASTQPLKNLHCKYMVPSNFSYNGLEKQQVVDLDQFIRSNIDNEHDKRNFTVEPGMDALPFRTQNGQMSPTYFASPFRDLTKGSDIELHATVSPGKSMLVPLRWNNPHASELEVNIWIFQGEQPIVVPIRKPTCSGEGYQDNIISFTIPADFSELGAKIPGFKGCNLDTRPMCTLQVYAHSVESRTYAFAFPIVIPGHNEQLTASSTEKIQPVLKDPRMDLSGLRQFCLPSNDPSANIQNAVPRWARLVSDVYNHAYQNSDFSPYSGQQHDSISRNLQASAINKMVVGNRGELGKSILPKETYDRLVALQALESRIFRNYESLTYKMIRRIYLEMTTTGQVSADGSTQQLAKCFRCAEVGSITAKFRGTSTYIPSFTITNPHLLRAVEGIVPQRYHNLIENSGKIEIYVATLKDLLPFFYTVAPFGILYQEAMQKSALVTMDDTTSFRKIDEKGVYDGGQYAATMAKNNLAKKQGCPAQCLTCKSGAKALIKGASATCTTGECSQCMEFFVDASFTDPPKVSKLANDIVNSGFPDGFAGVAGYPDPDGSPRFGRPGWAAKPATIKWKLRLSPTMPPTPAPTQPPTQSPTTRRHRRRVTSRRRSSRRRSSRRRSSRRRRRGKSRRRQAKSGA